MPQALLLATLAGVASGVVLAAAVLGEPGLVVATAAAIIGPSLLGLALFLAWRPPAGAPRAA